MGLSIEILHGEQIHPPRHTRLLMYEPPYHDDNINEQEHDQAISSSSMVPARNHIIHRKRSSFDLRGDFKRATETTRELAMTSR